MPNIIFVNGPPGSGKDTVANYFFTTRGYEQLKFAEPIREAVTRHFGIADVDIEAWKRQDIGNGKIGRDFMIAYSECMIKPINGIDWFGVNAAKSIKVEGVDNYVISDAGFGYEVEACINTLRRYAEEDPAFPRYTYQLIHIHRQGHSFKGDSRGWIEPEGLAPIKVVNDGTIEDLFRDLDYIFRRA